MLTHVCNEKVYMDAWAVKPFGYRAFYYRWRQITRKEFLGNAIIDIVTPQVVSGLDSIARLTIVSHCGRD